MRVVLDTNVLIDGAGDDFSAAAKLVQAAIDGEIEALMTPAIEREYRRKAAQLVADDSYQEHLTDFYRAAQLVEPALVEEQVDDREDRKFLQAAVGGKADLLITADRHLLQLGEIATTRIVTAPEGWVACQEAMGKSGEWDSWISGWGLGR